MSLQELKGLLEEDILPLMEAKRQEQEEWYKIINKAVRNAMVEVVNAMYGKK